MRWIACCLLFSAAAGAQSRLAVDWRKLEPEIVANFTTLLKIDTSNPPGNETQAAKAIQRILEHEGIRPCLGDAHVRARPRRRARRRIK